MRTHTIIASAFAAIGLMTGCGESTRTYQLTGQILVMKPEVKEVMVKHDDIPGFMPAMTMLYTVNNAAMLVNLDAGDLITATLKVAPDGAFPVLAIADR